MHWTCIECPPQRVDGEDELVIFNFYSEVRQHPEINESTIKLSKSVHHLLLSLDHYLNDWKHYRPLWEKNRAMVHEKFAAKNPACVMFDDKLQHLALIRQEILQEPLFKNVFIVRLNLQPLVFTVLDLVESWMNSLGNLLNKSARKELYDLGEEFMVIKHVLNKMFTLNMFNFPPILCFIVLNSNSLRG